MEKRKINILDLLRNNFSAAISRFRLQTTQRSSMNTPYSLPRVSLFFRQRPIRLRRTLEIWKFRYESYCAVGLRHMGAVILGVTGFFAMVFVASAAALIHVPFTSQAPFGHWAQPWQDFCEEASVVMAAHFAWGVPLTPKLAETEMQIIKQYEEIIFKKHKDTSVQETATILTNLFGFKNIRVRDVTAVSDIKEELGRGNIVIAPVAGRLLKNPYFTPPGPLYHMLVIRGFNDTNNTFITNDPGTRRGNGFAYNQELLVAAIHDWNGGDVMRGEKKIIVVGR